MDNRLTYPEIWLLELGVNHRAAWLPLGYLPDSESEQREGFSQLWNCPTNDLSVGELSEVIWDLWRQGDIEFERIIRDGDLTNVPFQPTDRSVLQNTLANEFDIATHCPPPWKHGSPFQHYYRVTNIGIASWEGFAVPNWSRFRGELTGRLWEPGETIWSQSASNEAFAREVLEIYASDVFEPATIHWKTIHVEGHTPWVPFEGKQLPTAVTVSVHVTEHGQRQIPCDEWAALSPQNDMHQQRFAEICHWYKNGVCNHPNRPTPETVNEQSERETT